MPSLFYKFPTTPHLADLGNNLIRTDKVFTTSEKDFFLKHEICVEEKVDGANLGISFDSNGKLLVQNRGELLHFPYTGQWKKLSEWITPKIDRLFDVLTNRYILFGEWCYAQHSIYYTQLPDWFLAFDVYEKSSQFFLSLPQRDIILKKIQINHVPFIKRGVFSFNELIKTMGQSQLTEGPAEGIYLRFDKQNWLQQRAKLVHPHFTQSIDTHWTKQGIKPNRIDYMRSETFL